MCMISDQIKSVGSTKIFCGVNKHQTKQLTVYANTVNNVSNNNAMVLPVPFPKSVEFYNFENYKNFFDDCADCFYSAAKGLSFTNEADGFSYGTKESTLKVYNVGSYKVSLAHSLADLRKVNKTVFNLTDGLEDVLRKYYSKPLFGFIICKLVTGNEKYHPFAYSHNILPHKVFIPTRHYHDESHQSYFSDFAYTQPYYNIDFFLMPQARQKSMSPDYADDWDHDIYLYNVDVTSNKQVMRMNKCHEIWSKKVKLNFDKIKFPLPTCKMFTKIQINGAHPNMDISLATY